MSRVVRLTAMLCCILVLGAACSESERAAAPHAARRAATAPASAPTPLERVQVTALNDPGEAATYLQSLGGHIEVQTGARVEAYVPADRLAELRAAPQLRVEPPVQPFPAQVTGVGELLGVDRWREAGFTGHGVRVAVVDTGFAGYEALLGSELPAHVHARSFRADGRLDTGSAHGTSAARIVYSIAPGADLYLLNFGTLSELSALADFVVAEHIDVVSFSVGFIHNGPGDGTGAVDDIVTRGMAGGALWTVAAGNWAQQHWAGTFTDRDGDSIHEFAPGVEEIGRAYRSGDLITVSLRWDEPWGHACTDYDLELFSPDDTLVRAAREVQACDRNPIESLQVLATREGRYRVRIVQHGPGAPRRLSLLMLGTPDRSQPLDFSVPAGSLAEPADHPRVLTVGAANTLTTSIVSAFSSRGPTTDGRLKPEVIAPSTRAGVDDEPSFTGTSAATPHVAAVAALLKEAFPALDADGLRAQIRARALDIPPVGSDSDSGAGLVQLGSLAGAGPTLPPGATSARLNGALPAGTGMAILGYLGPSGYPVRFAHLLTGGRSPAAVFRLVPGEGRWQEYIPGAPAFAQSFDQFRDGDLVVARYDAPAE